MTELREIIELVRRMDGISRLRANIDGWDISIFDERGTKNFTMLYTEPKEPTEAPEIDTEEEKE